MSDMIRRILEWFRSLGLGPSLGLKGEICIDGDGKGNGDDMSDMFDDDGLQDMIDRQMREARRPRRIDPSDGWRNTLWTTRTGEKIRIRDMEDTHLRNTIVYLLRRADGQFNEIVSNPPTTQSEMTQYYADQQYDHLMASGAEALLPPVYPLLVEELELRASSPTPAAAWVSSPSSSPLVVVLPSGKVLKC